MITFEKTMIISDITKNESNKCFVMHCLQLTTNTPSHDTQFDITLGNNALRVQPATDQSIGVRAGGARGTAVWATQFGQLIFFWAARENLGKACF